MLVRGGLMNAPKVYVSEVAFLQLVGATVIALNPDG